MNEPPIILPPPVQSSPQQILCDKCRSKMYPAKVYRLSSPLVIIGYILVIPSVLALVVVILSGLFAVGGSAAASNAARSDALSNTVVQLQKIDSLPPSYIELFKTNQAEAHLQVSTLPAGPVRDQADKAVSDYISLQITGVAVTGFAALWSGAILVVCFVVFLPLLIIGFLLILKRKVWRCANCSFVFDRA